MPTTEKELVERLTPKHLEGIPETEAELKKEVKENSRKTTSLDKKETDPEHDPKSYNEYTFDFDWTDGRGKVWKGKFVNKILTIGDKQSVGIMRARLADGLPVESIDPLTQEINLMVSHLAFSLKQRPKWAEDLLALNNVALLQEIYLEVASHEAIFLGYKANIKEGE